MKPRRFHGANQVYRLPGGNEDNDLWVERGVYHDHDLERPVLGITSIWELDDEEREMVANGANVALRVTGPAQPPVCLYVTEHPLGKEPSQ